MWKLNRNDNNRLLMLQISGKLSQNELSDILKAIYIENIAISANYNRFADLTNLKYIEIDIDTASCYIREYRCLIKPDKPIKISIFIPQKYVTGFSYLYKSISGHAMFEVKISDSLDECAKYLSVDKEVLQESSKLMEHSFVTIEENLTSLNR